MELLSTSCPVQHVLAIILMSAYALARSPGYYTGAVYDHNRQGDEYTDNAAAVIKANLDIYKTATKAAKQQGADIIVFPEYGIFAPLKRSRTKVYLEFIPNPKEITVTPCDEAQLFANRSILYTLSCLAKTNEIVIVANMGGIERCGNVPGCPEDGDLHLNANIAFDEKGTLIARYYKERLFYEFGMDLPREEQNPVFQTRFGKFATFICFDIIFEKISATSQLDDIDAILFSSMWMNTSPFYISTQWFQAWAMGNNATILASNIQMPGYLATGSGIFMGRNGSIGHTFNPDGISKLVVARIPKRNQGISSKCNITAIFQNGTTEEWHDNYKDIPEVCSYGILGRAKNIYKDYRCTQEIISNYTLVKLKRTEDHLQICNNNMCCELDYIANSMNESYYLGVYNGNVSPFTRYFWWEENCFMARCDDTNGTACSTFPMKSDTFFRKVHMTANFTSKRIFPSFVGDRAKLIPVQDWTFNTKPEWSSITLKSNSGIKLLAATLKGRAYDKDPPYVR